MGLFNFFSNRSNNEVFSSPKKEDFHLQNENTQNITPDISKELFVEDTEPSFKSSKEINSSKNLIGIDSIFFFLQSEFNQIGYNDALSIPDEKNRDDSINLLKLELRLLIKKSTIYYSDKLKEIDFHISTRSRAGLIDLVNELSIQKDIYNSHLKEIAAISTDLENHQGLFEKVISEYKKGFNKGLTEITRSKLLDLNK